MNDEGERRPRPDGRKPITIYLDPGLILDLKYEALKQQTHVYLMIEDMVKDWKARGIEREGRARGRD